MTEPTAKDIAAIRKETGAGIMDIKKALTDAKGDANKAKDLLKERGLAKAAKKGEREASEGLIHSYIHGNGRIGVLLELNCETDFVARNDEFKQLAQDLAMQIAAGNPTCISTDDAKKGENAEEVALLSQPFIKDPNTNMDAIIKALISKLGENIQIARFTRYELGQ